MVSANCNAISAVKRINCGEMHISFLIDVLISTMYRKLAQRYELRSTRSYCSICSKVLVRFNAKHSGPNSFDICDCFHVDYVN